MPRLSHQQLALLVTTLIALFAFFLGLQLRDSESLLMRSLQIPLSRPISKVNRAITPLSSRISTSSTSPTMTPDKPDEEHKESTLGLPAPPSAEDAQKLDLSGGQDSVKLDHLGPLVVNKDGTLSRISNWDKMTEQEKKSTLRILGKRNQLRTEALKMAEELDGTGKDKEAS